MRKLVMLLLAAPLIACGSSVSNDNPSDGGGGTGGTTCLGADCDPGCPAEPPTTGDGCDLSDFASCDFGCDGVYECQPVYPEAGAPSEWVKVSDGACCPEEAPTHGAACEGALSCTYEHSPWTEDCPGTFDAVCSDGTWEALKPASCEPVSTCDPTGSFAIVYGEWSPLLPYTSSPGELVIAIDDDGKIVTSAPEAVVTDDGCTLQAWWNAETCEDIEGETFCEIHDFIAEIDFSDGTPSGTPSGTMSYECSGECGVMASADITLETQ